VISVYRPAFNTARSLKRLQRQIKPEDLTRCNRDPCVQVPSAAEVNADTKAEQPVAKPDLDKDDGSDEEEEDYEGVEEDSDDDSSGSSSSSDSEGGEEREGAGEDSEEDILLDAAGPSAGKPAKRKRPEGEEGEAHILAGLSGDEVDAGNIIQGGRGARRGRPQAAAGHSSKPKYTAKPALDSDEDEW
jgi:hypothetical protein